jgi:hypothetical protein
MKEPKRLFESGSPLERTILGYGREEAPSEGLGKSTLAAIAAAAPLANAASEIPKPSRWTRPVTIAGVAAIGIGALIAFTSSRSPEPPAPVARPTVNVQPPPAPSAPATSENNIVTPDSLPNARPSVTPSAAPSVASATPHETGATSIAREVELLDAVKVKLASSEASGAARALDTYDAEFPRGTLRPEATVLRIRTLLLQGDRDGANRLGTAFLESHPSGVHAKRVRALLGENPSDK